MRPIPTRATKAAISKLAERLRQDCGVETGFDVADLISENRGEIEYISPLDDNQTDSIIVRPDESFEVRLSSLTGSLRDNFTLAHELGHYVLHWPKVKERQSQAGEVQGMTATRSLDEDDEEQVRCEWEANWFAAAFLMPEESFSKLWNEGGAEAAARNLGVSVAAAKVRARSLNLD